MHNQPQLGIKGVVLFVECMGPLLFFGRKTSILVLASWIIFHLGIFSMSGIFFWHWMGINLCLLILLLKFKFYEAAGPFSFLHRLLAVFLIIHSPYWARSTSLAWIESSVNYAYKFEALGESGRTYTLPPLFLLPTNIRLQ